MTDCRIVGSWLRDLNSDFSLPFRVTQQLKRKVQAVIRSGLGELCYSYWCVGKCGPLTSLCTKEGTNNREKKEVIYYWCGLSVEQ